jgi:hypothetical protein
MRREVDDGRSVLDGVLASLELLIICFLFLRVLLICLQVGYVGGVLFLVFAVATLLGVF